MLQIVFQGLPVLFNWVLIIFVQRNSLYLFFLVGVCILFVFKFFFVFLVRQSILIFFLGVFNKKIATPKQKKMRFLFCLQHHNTATHSLTMQIQHLLFFDNTHQFHFLCLIFLGQSKCEMLKLLCKYSNLQPHILLLLRLLILCIIFIFIYFFFGLVSGKKNQKHAKKKNLRSLPN